MNRPALYSFLLCLVAMLCATALIVTDHDAGPLLVLAGVGGGAGAMASPVASSITRRT